MSIIADVLSELFGGTLADVADPSTNRALVLLSTAASVVVSGLTAWFVVGSADPLNDPPWLLGMIALAMAFGVGSMCLSGLHVVREPGERVMGLACLALNVGASAAPLVALAI